MYIDFTNKKELNGLVNFTINSALYAIVGYNIAKVATVALFALGFSASTTAVVTSIPQTICALGILGVTAGATGCLVVFTAMIVLDVTHRLARR